MDRRRVRGHPPDPDREPPDPIDGGALQDREQHQKAAPIEPRPLPPGAPPRIGVLALQGDFEAHRKAFERSGVEAREVRLPEALEGLGGLVLPGGESTTLLRLVREYGFDRAIPRFAAEGGAIFGTCAGAILLARGVRSPEQWSVDLVDIDVERNAYGRQIDSFETRLTDVAPELMNGTVTHEEALPAVFIRAPRILRVGENVSILASRQGEPVMVRSGRILVSTFHPELTTDPRVHSYFARLVGYISRR